MKKELLEYLIRECVKEVLEAFPMEPQVSGAPAVPTIPQTPEQGSGPLFTADTRGIWFVDPKKIDKPTQLKIDSQDPTALERQLYRTAVKSGGPRVKIAGETLREVPKVAANPNIALFLYIGKRNTEEDDSELFLLPAKTFQQAKSMSVNPSQSAEHDVTAIAQAPEDPSDIAHNIQTQQAGGMTMAPDIDESKTLKGMLSAMVKEAISELK